MGRMFWLGGVVVGAVVGGVAAAQPTSRPGGAGEPVGRQLVRMEPEMQGVRFNVLLNFERPTDGVFVRAEGGTAGISGERAHTGGQALELPAGVTGLRVNLASLMEGRAFPGDWGLAGGYFYTDGEAEVTAEYVRQGKPAAKRKVALAKGAWTKVMVDVAAVAMLEQGGQQAGISDGLAFTISAPQGARVWCDDIVIVNNAQVLASGGAERLTVKRSGLGYIIGRPRAYAFRLPAGDEPEAVKVVEAGPVRAVFRTAEGKTFCFYADGRALADGRQMLKGRESYERYQLAQEHPARIEVSEELGRLDRTTAGDADNDGFNESRGAYAIKGSTPGVDVTLEPAAGGYPMLRPVLEISGLGAGKVTASVEGQPVDEVERLPDGRVVVVLPIDLQRRTTVEVRVQ